MRILFVCSGNTCRSPMAEALFRDLWEREERPVPLTVGSAGLAAVPGEKASSHARKLLAERGIDLESHRSRLLQEDLVKETELILVMTRLQRSLLLDRFPEARGKVHLLKEYAGMEDGEPDISDPFGGDLEKYRRTLEEIEAILPKVLANILNEGGRQDESSSR